MFIALEVAEQLVRSLRDVIAVVARHDPSLAGEVRRAGASVILNLSEGQRRVGRDHHRLAAPQAQAQQERNAGCRPATQTTTLTNLESARGSRSEPRRGSPVGRRIEARQMIRRARRVGAAAEVIRPASGARTVWEGGSRGAAV